MKSEIILYRPDELVEHIEVRMDEDQETFWLTQDQIAQLFERDRTVISKHLKNIFQEGELEEKEVCAFFARTTPHGAIKGKTQIKEVKYYNLDAILCVGYRVNSKRGTQFRIWATRVLKDYLLKGFDEQEEYHLGASLKNLGKKPVARSIEPWSAFSKMNARSMVKIINFNWERI